ncbi:MAG: hypothetical protein NXY57DRAFT_1025841 [Lentinula lateritia]|uniref:25S rRNA (uridine-N(3))-methyltransferase BMT5-like domain-containing protein n=1 Tax=Lentinula lateritia TaxID=40482 RepID=A0ABQ8VYR2_9AGAR|nr:MAG: hypothetical protein NXY57DRAFT_1025841 [Lentinula lateritia]KAJ4500712.1 hypothetical protein C8R41DRAFT_913798 [Lentinula lateritia]
MGRSSKSLKNALSSQQSRLKGKEKASHAAQIAEQKARKLAGGPSASSRSKANQTTGQRNEIMRAPGKGKRTLPSTQKPTIPFQPTDTILLIGEGNFSFAHALARPSPSKAELAHLAHLPSQNITATAYDSEEDCYAKYPDAKDIVADLRGWGVEVLFSVDATKLEWNITFKGRRWSKIVWNFPHAGRGINDQDRNILSNQTLILGFLHSAAKFLKQGPVPSVAGRKKQKASDVDEDEGEETDNDTRDSLESGSCRGTILITLRNVPPYTLWDVPKLAKNPPSLAQGSTSSNPRYIILRSFAFHREIWDGYEHRMTKGLRAHGTGKTGEGGEDRTWEFCLRDIPDV